MIATDYLTAALYSIASIKYTSGSFEFAQWIGYVGRLPIILAVAFYVIGVIYLIIAEKNREGR